MTNALVEVVKNTSSVAKENRKEGDLVVLLDELKKKLTAYEEPLKDLRDSL